MDTLNQMQALIQEVNLLQESFGLIVFSLLRSYLTKVKIFLLQFKGMLISLLELLITLSKLS